MSRKRNDASSPSWDELAADFVETCKRLSNEGHREFIAAQLRESGIDLDPWWSDWIGSFCNNPAVAVQTLQIRIFSMLFRQQSTAQQDPHIGWSDDLERVLNVIWAYRNRIVAGRLHASLPNKPGMDSANSLGTLLAQDLDLNQNDELLLDTQADPVLAGRRWLTRLRTRLKNRVFFPTDSDAVVSSDEIIALLLPLLPDKPGRPIS